MSLASGKPTILLPRNGNAREKLVSSSDDIKRGSAMPTNGPHKYVNYNRSDQFDIGRGYSPRWSKLMKLYNCFNLRVLFRTLGSLIGCYPWAFVVSSLIIASLSLGMLKLRLQNRVRDGYTPSTSRARYEMDVLKEFFGSAGDPLLTTVLLRAKDRGSMHRVDYLAEAVHLHNHIRYNITVAHHELEVDVAAGPDGRLVRYIDICGPFCDANVAVDYFYGALTSQLDSVQNGRKIYASTNLSYPIAKLNGYELHLERNFFGVKTNNNLTSTLGGGDVNAGNDSITATDQLQELSRVTSIRHIEAIMFVFRGDISRPEDERKMTEWEMTLYKFATKHFRSLIVEMLVLGNEVVDYEMNRDARRTAPYFAMGFLFMFTFAFFTLLFSSSFYGILDWAKCALALAISLCPALAITTTFGICALIGLRTNSVMLIMPFLICGIGVNDAFLICHSWNRLAHCQLSIPDRLGLVLEETGPSVTITTLTNVVTFAIGALTPTPEISLFCLATAIALGLAYIFTVTFFTSFLYFATLVEHRMMAQESSKDDTTSFCSTVQNMLHNLCDGMATAYCELLLNRCFLMVLLTGTVVYWYFALLGTLNIHAKLDTEKILPANCPILEPHRIVSHLVWTEYYPVTVLVNRPLDIRLRRDLDTFNAMVDEFEALEKCKGKQFTMLWLRDYVSYCKMVKDYGFDYFSFEEADSSDESAVSGERRNGTVVGGDSHASETELDFTKVDEFLSSPLYRHYRPFLKMANSTSDARGLVPITRFWLTITYHNTTDWQDRIDLMQEWRRVAQKYSALNVTVWETNGMFVDQMLSLKALTLQTALLTLACMAIVCTIFIQNPFSVITAVLAIGSISVGVVGYLSWWHLNLDPVTLCAVLMSIGMSVDFTAHICYHFQLTKKQRIRNGGTIVEEPLRTSAEKLRNTVESVAWPMTQAGASTVICVMPLVFLQDYIPLVFVKTVFLVAIWGFFHGLVLMPAVLAALPTSLMELNCYEMLMQRLSASSFTRTDESGVSMTLPQTI